MQKSTRGLAFFLVYRLIEWKKIHGKNVKQNTLDFFKKTIKFDHEFQSSSIRATALAV